MSEFYTKIIVLKTVTSIYLTPLTAKDHVGVVTLNPTDSQDFVTRRREGKGKENSLSAKSTAAPHHVGLIQRIRRGTSCQPIHHSLLS
mmetsp:Transcript_47476/g.88147  ORF Transcript_47476/g.88147 Transcript_47476/m.88147 type:complete len:88 (-) Transcript_47476:1961-2224(-)